MDRFAEEAARPRFNSDAWRRQDCVKREDNMVVEAVVIEFVVSTGRRGPTLRVPVVIAERQGESCLEAKAEPVYPIALAEPFLDEEADTDDFVEATLQPSPDNST